MYARDRKGLNGSNGIGQDLYICEEMPIETGDTYDETRDIFPALKQYKSDHNSVNFQKLCFQISEFCQSVYASTRNEAERNIYRAMVEKLNK